MMREFLWPLLDNELAKRIGVADGKPIRVIHGQCPNGGVDKCADDWGTARGHDVKRYPAKWGQWGNSAGPVRNKQMVDSGPDLCIGFPSPRSRGTWDCLQKAVDADVLTVVYPIYPKRWPRPDGGHTPRAA